MYVYRLSNELAQRGHSVDIFYSQDAYLLFQKTGARGNFPNHPNITLRNLKSRAGFLSPLLTQQTGRPFFKREIKTALESKGYDVIHYHNMSLIGITALGYGKGAIKLYTTHEHWLICPMHVLWKFDREVCEKKECTACQLVGKRPPQLWRHGSLLENNVKNVDCFISPSRFTLKRHLKDGLQIPIKHIPYFLPTPPETRSQKQIKPNPYFLFVGRLERIKGLQNIIPIFRANQNYELLIAGDGEFKADLLKLADNSPNIKFLGKLEQYQLRDVYRQARAVIVPSICYETFGIIIIEAFAMKTPVIVHNLGALPETVDDSGGGFVYNNEKDLLKALKQLAENSELRDDLGNKGHAAFLKYWNEDAHLAQYFKLIGEIQHKNKLKKSE